MTGKKASMGPARLTPKTEPSQPHWNTATRIPKAAPIESMFIAAEIRGMTRLRNTTGQQEERTTGRPGR